MNKFEDNKKRNVYNNLDYNILNHFNINNSKDAKLLLIIDKLIEKEYNLLFEDKLEKKISGDIVGFGKNDPYRRPDFDLSEIDDETIELMRTFLSNESEFSEELFSNPKIEEFHRKIHEIIDPRVLIEIGKQKMDQIENGQVEEKELELVEAEIILLFTQILFLRKINVYTRSNYPDKEDIKKTQTIKNYETETIKEKEYEEPHDIIYHR